MTDCLFCKIVSGDLPARVVYEDENCLAFLDINPATEGHTLVIPKEHVKNFLETNEEQAVQVMKTMRHVAGLLNDKLAPAGMNVIQSNGASAWQEVFHLHFHLIPRYESDGLTPPWHGRPGDGADLDATLDKLKG